MSLNIINDSNYIDLSRTYLGIELGSTRIKAVLINDKHKVITSGEHTWENKYINSNWTYELDEVWESLRSCFKQLADNTYELYGIKLSKVGAIGISAMMHGYLVFDSNEKLLVPFRTWRNNNAEQAAIDLTELFHYPIPARWSVAHLYQAIIGKETHISDISYQTTLAGYVHWKLTGRKVVGIGEASGMFPIDMDSKQYNINMLNEFNSILDNNRLPYHLQDILPEILNAGDTAGYLTEEGAMLLDPSGFLEANIPFAAPEGDAGTGMVATNSISSRTGNISAGTSIFSMIVLEQKLTKVYKDVDLVTTPEGRLVAMVHCNNCSSEINSWVKLFEDLFVMMNYDIKKDELFNKLFNLSLEGKENCGGLLAYNYLSGENVTNVSCGRPMFIRTPNSEFNLKNFIKAQLYSSMVTLKLGLDKLIAEENIVIDNINAHGGLFRTENVCQKYLASAIGVPITVMESVGEGGPYGMAILAAYIVNKGNLSLEQYINNYVFDGVKEKTIQPDKDLAVGFNVYAENFRKGLSIIREAGITIEEN